ncbi:MAG TPA: DUF3365 domain-containing protein [Spirochaetes bacterium]|nr:DUF3365 domain-containing protein [Spirochaetota bacterium]
MKSVGMRFLLLFGLLILILSLFMLYWAHRVSREHAQDLMSRQASIALEFNLAILSYVGNYVRPELVRKLGKGYFMPETMSTSYISRSVFEKVQEKFPDFIIRFASDNPRNPINAATSEELEIINYFRQNRNAARVSRVMILNGRRYLALFNPRWLQKDCMRCHGNPKDAPAELIRRYGNTASFNRLIDDLAGLDTVAVQLDAFDDALHSEMYRQWFIITVVLLLLFGTVMVLFHRVVTKRLKAIIKHFSDIADNPDSTRMTPLKLGGKDEIAVLGSSFNHLIEKLSESHSMLEHRVAERTIKLTGVNEELKREITDRTRAEEALKKSLEENQALLRELQHRVKNSLAIITGLIGIEAKRMDDPAANEALTNIRNRVNSLSKLYDQLYNANEVREVRLDAYLEQMARSLMDTYDSPEKSIDLRTELAPLKIDVKQSISVGLILNELLTNALKYAFTDRSGGTIRIDLRKSDGGAVIEVADDGAGLPQGFSLEGSRGRGMEIVQMLVATLKGEMEYGRGRETVFRVSFPV